MLFQDFLETCADRLPEKFALVCEDQRLSSAEIESQTNRLANAMRQNGVQRGDRIAIYLPNSIPAVVGIFAALKAGGVFVVINSTTKQDKLISILNNCRATALMITGRNPELIEVYWLLPHRSLYVKTGQPDTQASINSNLTLQSCNMMQSSAMV
jgi:acyl-CoA synthetase (AMP-forming)/AMP-acid ligase II